MNIGDGCKGLRFQMSDKAYPVYGVGSRNRIIMGHMDLMGDWERQTYL